MQTSVTFKQIDPSDALKSYVQKKVDRFDKMLESPAEANVVLSVEKIRHIAEITLVCDRLKIHAKEESENMYSSIDTLMDKVAGQIKKNKDKMRRHMSGNKASIKDNDILLTPPEAASDTSTPEVIMEAIDVKPIDIDDAVMELNSGKENFFVFSNARTERVNVLYRRNDGKLGLIQPRR
ncbi:SmpA [Desulforapulum autotrophicum HRM2]|uniref:Ribosome hibernation promoting factor n=1 Tax=Desulforapulum autotrophicum (strain ATCC 43914 / DSM 3382 / VKM B-1955 / HRM2) TaxID=177437 RepID=C0QJ65_DESAH|nr:ribosome-associated translation inhibitor RaiA [Desulforapulum autotrophicum]ACN15878.1 SmpA [Desulforapulum autotrophicum HRM2]